MKITPLKDFDIVQPPFELRLKKGVEVDLPSQYIRNMITEGVILENQPNEKGQNLTIEE